MSFPQYIYRGIFIKSSRVVHSFFLCTALLSFIWSGQDFVGASVDDSHGMTVRNSTDSDYMSSEGPSNFDKFWEKKKNEIYKMNKNNRRQMLSEWVSMGSQIRKREAQQSNSDADFEDLNELLDGFVVEIPDTEVTTDLPFPFQPLTMELSDIMCFNFFIEDLNMENEINSKNTLLEFSLEVEGLGITCSMNWGYSSGILKGKGTAEMAVRDSDASLGISFESRQGFDNAPPTDLEVTKCDADIIIEDIVLEGGVAATIVNFFEEALRDTFTDLLVSVACDQLTDLDSVVDSILTNVSDVLDGIKDYEESDLLEMEKNYIMPEDTRIIDFMSNIDSYDINFTQFFAIFNESLAAEVEDTTGGTDLGINIMLRDYLLDESGVFSFTPDDIPDFIFCGFVIPVFKDGVVYSGQDFLSNTTISWTEIRILGLDTFSNILLPTIIGKHTLMSSMKWNVIHLEIDLTIQIEASSDEATSSQQTEYITIKTGVQDLELSFAAFAAIDLDYLGSIMIGSLLRFDQIIPCFMGALRSLHFTSLYFNVGNIIEPTVEGFISTSVDSALNDAAEVVFSMYESSIIGSIPGGFETTVRDAVNAFFSDCLVDYVECPEPDTKGLKYVDFRDALMNEADAKSAGAVGSSTYGDIIPQLRDFIMDQFFANDPATGEPQINSKLIEPITSYISGTPGTLAFDDTLLNMTFNINIEAIDLEVTVRMSEVLMENLNSMGQPLEIMKPRSTEPNMIDNKVTFGANSKPLKASTRLFLAVKGNGMDMMNDMEIGLELDAVPFFAAFLAKVEASRILNFPLRDMANPHCWIATLPAPQLDSEGLRVSSSEATVALTDLDIAIERVKISSKCFECTSPGMFDLSSTVSTDEASISATETLNDLLQTFESFLEGDFAQVQLDRILNDAMKKCPQYPGSYSLNSAETDYSLNYSNARDDDKLYIVNLILIVMVILVGFLLGFRVLYWKINRNHVRWLGTLSRDDVQSVYLKQAKRKNHQKALNDSTKPMFRSTEIPFFVRILMPVVIVFNIALFISGHISLAATLNIYVQVTGEDLTVENFWEFSMSQSTQDMWAAGAKVLAMLIYIFSGAWPYTKQLIAMYLWFAPVEKVSIGRRGSLYVLLDNLAKWSMFDIFILIISLVSFRISIASPEYAFLPKGFYFVDLMVVPIWGLYANMTAQLLSQVSSHFIIYYHRKIARAAHYTEKENTCHDIIDNKTLDLSCKPTLASVYSKTESETCLPLVSENVATNEVDGNKNDVHGEHEFINTLNDSRAHNEGKSSSQGENERDGECLKMNLHIEQSEEVELNTVGRLRENSEIKSNLEVKEASSAILVNHPSVVDLRYSLRKHKYLLEWGNDGQTRQTQKMADTVVALTAAFTIIFIVWGCCVSCISLEVQGLVGLVIEVGQEGESAIQTHSLISMLQLILDQAYYLDTVNDYVGLGSLAILFIGTTLIVPLFLVILLTSFWFLPLDHSERDQLSTSIEIMEAWQYLEVFFIGLVAGSWQLEQVSTYMMEDYCGKETESIFNTMEYFGIVSSSDAQCFNVDSNLKEGAYIILCGTFLLAFLSNLVKQAVKQQKHDIERILERHKELSSSDTSYLNLSGKRKDDIIELIDPVPTRFTDVYHCLLGFDRSLQPNIEL